MDMLIQLVTAFAASVGFALPLHVRQEKLLLASLGGLLAWGVYLLMGWVALFALYPLSKVLSAEGFFWLVLGGVLYTAGGVLYAVKWPGRDNPRFGCHEIFHVFILLGSITHFAMMYRVVLWL